MHIKVGTRGSQLALTQTKWVISELEKTHTNDTFEIVIIKTKGDLIQNVALDKIGDKGLFVKEIEEQLLNDKIDLAIHSMKDMPSVITEGLEFSKIPKREDRRDVLVLKKGYNSLDDLPNGAKIGTGSKRRIYQLLALRPDLEMAPIRGNIDTRIKKIETDNLDGVVLAAAGLHRIGLKDCITCYLDENQVIPAPAQGALGIQYSKKNKTIKKMIEHIESHIEDLEVQAERSFLNAVEGSCHLPIGATAHIDNGVMTLTALFGAEDGTRLKKNTITKQCSTENDAKELGIQLANLLREE
ncbi:MAG: hydroxymethylbilane synthase [Cellulosilyticaceae bacterium]